MTRTDNQTNQEDVVVVTRTKRVVTDEDITKYEPMVERYIRENTIKNWSEARLGKQNGEVSLGNTGMSLNDIRQYLRTEVCVALTNFNPDYRTKEGKTVKESTFVYGHLFKRLGSLMKRLTKKSYGYSVWSVPIDEVIGEHFDNE